MVKETRNIRRQVLPNGLTVITEQMSHIRSVSIGIWLKTGSRDETSEWNGISHFIEHMVFKGTETRTAEAIARQVDSIGGNMDAFTAKECICFNIKVLDEHVATALDVLSDLVLNPVFAAEEIARERGVILEEIKMDEDSPDTLVHEIFMQNFWKGHPLGKPILGTRETVRSFEQNTLVRFFEQRFQAGNMVFSAAGNIEHDSFVEQVASHFNSLAPGSVLSDSGAPTVTPRIHLRNKKSLEQVQLCLGVPAPPIGDESRYTTLLLNTILGGGMSSRLFQTVREERGLVYAIYSDLAPYRDTGSLCVYAGTSADRALQVIDLIMEEFRRLKTEPLQPGELRRAQDQLKGNLLLSLESSMSRMSNLARQQMYFERFFGLDEIIDRVEAVTEDEVMAMATELFKPDKVALTLLGRLDGLHLNRSQLVC